MSLFDLIVEAVNKVKSNGAGLYNKIKGVQAPQLNMELLSEDGGTDITKTMEMLDKTTPLNFKERMLGRELQRDFQKYNPETKQFEMTTATINRPGLLQDISQGYEENRFTPASIANLQQNTLDNGREKGFAYRLGEGLGSLARLGNSPLGRGLITGGIVGATGGNGLEALTYGAGATMLNQGNVLRDRTYRNDLINTQKQSLMSSPEWNNLTPAQQQARLSEIENSINNYRGYMTDDIYKNLVNTQQARDNAAYRNLLLQTQMQNNAALLALKQQEAQRQAQQDAFDNYYKKQNLAQGWAKIKADAEKAQGKPLSDTQVTDLKNLNNALNDADEIIKKYSDSKYDAGFGLVGAARRNPLTSKFDPLATEMRQDIDLFRKTVARAKEGGRLTDQDQKYYEKAVLNPNLSREDFISLTKEFKNKMERQRDTALDMYELQGKNVDNFRNYYQNNKKDTLGIL